MHSGGQRRTFAVKHRLGTPLPWVFILATAGLALLLGGTPTWWLGSALLWGAFGLAYQGRHTFLADLWPGAERVSAVSEAEHVEAKPPDGAATKRSYRAALRALAYPLLLVAIALTMMSNPLLDERPVSHDHTVHYVKAWQLKEHLLPSGRLFGWSHRFFAGYPANYLYPIGADLWVVLFYGLGLGALSFSQAYGVAFAAFFAFQGLAGYRFGRAFFGPHVGFITGLLLLTDLSEFRMGGWAYSIEFGVWPQALSLAFSLLALAEVPRLFASNDVRGVALFGLFMGLAVLCHPVVLIFLALIAVVCIIAALLADDASTLSSSARLFCACLLAIAVASLWLIPFLSTREYTSAMGVFWDTTYQMGRDLLSLSTFKGTLPAVLALGILALPFTLRTREFGKLFIALGALVVPLVSSSSFVDELHLAEVNPVFTKVQFLRMATMVKPFWFALSGFGLVTLIRLTRRNVPVPPFPRPDPAETAAPSYVRTTSLHILVALLTLPFLVPLVQVFLVDHVLKHQRTVHDREYLQARTNLTRYLHEHLPDDGFYRLGIFMGHNHELIDLATEIGHPIYKHGFTPCTNFIYKMQGQDAEILRAVRVRYVISKQPLDAGDFTVVKRFGIYGLYKFKHYDPHPYDLLGGQADVRMRRFDDEHIEFDVADVAADGAGQLQLPVSWFPRWHAYRDGQPIELTRRSLAAEADKTGFITLPLAPGHYEVRFERSGADHFAVVLGLCSIGLCLLLWGGAYYAPVGQRCNRICAQVERLDRFAAPAYRPWRVAALVAVALGAGGVFTVLSLWRPGLRPDDYTGYQPVKSVRYDFVEQVTDATAIVRFRDHGRHCRSMGDRLVCPDNQGNLDSDRFVASQPTTIEEYRMVRCIRARPQDGGVLEVMFPRVPRGKRLVGYYGIDFESRLLFYRRPVDFAIEFDGRRVYKQATERDNHMHWFELQVPPGEKSTTDVRFAVSSANANMRWFCFQAQMAGD